MLLDLLKNGFGKAANYTEAEKIRFGGVNLNCCERILYGANEAYGLGLSDSSLRVSAPFGGGMGIGSICGAVTGALMVLSLKYCTGTEKQAPLKDEITIPFLGRVRAKMGGLTCRYYKPRYATLEPFNCDAVIFSIAQALDETIADLDRNKKS